MGNMEVYGNTFNYAGTVTGISTQSYDNTTLNLTPDLSNAATEIVLYRSTVNGPGTLINAAGRELLLNQVTCNADLDNHGDLTCWRDVDLNGGFVSPAGSAIKVEGSGSYDAYLSLVNSFTNNATLELTSSHVSRTAILTVDGGLLMNDTGGVILTSAGTGGANRTLNAELDNRGLVTVNHPFTIHKSGSHHMSSGTIELIGGDLSILQSGTTPSFSNAGTIDIGSGRIMTVNNNVFTNLVTGLIQGNGVLDLAGTTSGLINQGTVAPGVSAGQLSLAGDFNADAAGALQMEIGGPVAGSGYDRFAISGAANLDGTLDAVLINGFEPDQYDSFTIATFASRSGTFASTDLPSTHLYGWEVDYTNTSVKLTVVNTAPTFDAVASQEVDELTELTVDASATDTDTPTQTLTYSLLNEPSGAGIDPGSGLFSWTPAESQGPGTNTITVRVVDDGTPNLSATNQFDVVINEVNSAPGFFETPTNRSMDELTLLTVTNAAGDADIPTNTLAYSLLTPPAGAAINPTNGIITWMPSEAQGPGTNTIVSVVTDDGNPVLSATNEFQVYVNEVNMVPVFDGTPDNAIVNELTLFTVTNAASDVDLPTNTLVYSLLAPPAGAVIHPASGMITWTPGEDQGPDTNVIVSVVTDGGIPSLSATNSFQIIVTEVNTVPVFDAVPDDTTVDELTALVITNRATDADIPDYGLVYGLMDAPAGAAIHPASGVISWTPTEDQGPGTNTITTIVTDGGIPALSATNAFQVFINEVNTVPVFDTVPSDVTLDELTLLSLANAATDADLPVNGLVYGLLNAPAGAAINPAKRGNHLDAGRRPGPGNQYDHHHRYR
jgi:hypothetical protein